MTSKLIETKCKKDLNPHFYIDKNNKKQCVTIPIFKYKNKKELLRSIVDLINIKDRSNCLYLILNNDGRIGLATMHKDAEIISENYTFKVKNG